MATTVVRAPGAVQQGIRCGVHRRHTYFKVTGNARPDLRFTARPYGGRRRATVGDVIRARGARFRARVLGGGRELLIVKDGATVASIPVRSDRFRYRFEAPAAVGGGCS
jgi:hypothetical protein